MAKIAVLGCGFGTALAVMLSKNGHEVVAWTKFQDEIDAILKDREHKKLLPGVKIPEEIDFTTDISCIKGVDVLIVAIPSQFVREAVRKAAEHITENTVVLNVGKGFEAGTNNRLSQIIREEIPHNPIVVMAGPCHAEEVGIGVPTTVVVASDNMEYAEYIQDTFSNKTFRIYCNDDVIGCEIAPALKNPIALACGIVEGMGLGDNTLAALMTRGLTEITRLGVAMGARWETFTGLAGVGDLIVTCTSMHSRNHRAGLLIGKGTPVKEAIAQVGTVEGYGCAEIVYGIAKEKGVSMPIIEQLYHICFEEKPSHEGLRTLMNRPTKHEKEPFWN